jgi:uncharacterized iron-regulated membrane protein
MLTAKTVRTWYKTHKWTSLICTAFLLMSCLTGLPMIFDDEIDHLTDHHVLPAALPANAPSASLDGIVGVGKLHYPKQYPLFLGWDDDEPRIFLTMAPSLDPKPHESHSLIFDAHTGKLLEEPKPQFSLMGFFTSLHVDLYADLPGELLLGFMASLFVVSLVSGAVVYGPFMRKLDFGTVRGDSARRVKWFDLHNLLGIVTLSWAVVVGATGVMNTLSTPLFGLWRAQEMPHLLAPYKGKPMPEHYGSLDAAVAIARQALPGMEITSVDFPNPKFSSPRHYLIWTRGRTPLTSRLFTPVLVDAENGKLSQARGLPWYLRTLEVSRPLHFGDYGGLPLKILWAFFDVVLIVVLGSGLYLWLTRRKRPIEAELDALALLEEAKQGAAA